MIVRRVLWFVVMAVVLAVSCGRSNPLKSRKVVLIVRTLTDPFYTRMAEGAQRAAADLGLDLAIMGIDKETDVEKQMALVETQVITRVGAIVIAPADSRALVGPLKAATDKGIIVINVDNPLDQALLPKSGIRIPFVGPDDKEGGRKLGAFLIDRLGGKGKVAVLEGVAGVLSAERRTEGFLEACKGSPGIQIAARQVANWRRKDAAEALGKMLSDHPDLKGVFALNPAMALGAVDALKGKAGEVVVVACNDGKDLQEAIAAGQIAATLDAHPDRMGKQAIELAKKALDGKTVPDSTPTPLDLVDAKALANRPPEAR